MDSFLKHECDNDSADVPGDDEELEEFRAVLQCLSEVGIEPPASFGDDLLSSLPAMAERESSWLHATFWGRLIAWFTAGRDRLVGVLPARTGLVPALSSAILLTVVAVTIVLLRSVVDPSVVSASEILSRSDAALGTLVRPGQLLYRRWKVTSTSTRAGGLTGPNTVRIIDEWMDGADVNRVAGRWYASDDRLLIAYTSVGNGSERRPNVYFSPGVYGEARGVLNIEPTRDEFMEAATRFPEPIQSALKAYLDRQYIYVPITRERRFNRAIIEAPQYGKSELPRVVSSVDQSETFRGQAVYRVRLVDPASIDFNWRSQGPPRVRLAWVETVSYIARDSYLGLKTEQTLKFEDGRQRVTTKELLETRAVDIADANLDSFNLDVPQGTPVRRQSALEQLSGVSNAFSRLPQFAATLEHTHTRD
jgi:hypothetical protein